MRLRDPSEAKVSLSPNLGDLYRRSIIAVYKVNRQETAGEKEL